MNKNQELKLGRWLKENKGNLGKLALVVFIAAGMVFGLTTSDKVDRLEQAYLPLSPLAPPEVQAKANAMMAWWEENREFVTDLEELLDSENVIEAQGITNFDQLYLQARSTTSVLEVDQLSTGNIVDFQDGSSSVWTLADAGALTHTGAYTHTGTTSETGNQTVNGTLTVDGAADAVQFTAQGYTTQTSNLAVFENSAGVDLVTISGAGATMLTGTLDVRGSVSDGAGALELADNTIIDGQADAVQLTVQGHTTNTNYLFVVEQSDGTDVWRTNVSGQNSSANGAVSFVDDVIVDGAEDTDQLTVQGYTTQTNDLQVWEQYDGTDVGTVTNAGALDVASTVNYGSDNLYPLGYASASQQIECGVTATFTDTVAVTASALTTATYAVATQITDPAATASILTVDAPSANVFNIDSWESDFTVGTTGITVYWCAIGNQ